jgi:acetyltransferase-like isoleucine patch superfamily enzyme
MSNPVRSSSFHRVWQGAWTHYDSWHFQRKCHCVGRNLSVLGRCFIHGRGRIEIGDDFVIRSPRYNQVELFVDEGVSLRIGDDVFINQGVRIVCTVDVEIGDHCLIADETVILDNDYHSIGNNSVKKGPVHIEKHVWLATRVIVLRGVTIGEGSVVGAGSVVTHSIPPYTFAAGNPARVIRSLR